MGGIFLDTGKSIWIQKSSRVVKGLIVSYLVSGTGLLLLALLLLKCQLDEGKVSAGILAVYVLSGLCGGNLYGKNSGKKEISVGNGTRRDVLDHSDEHYGVFRCGYRNGSERCISYAAHLRRIVNFGRDGGGRVKIA